MTYEQALEKGYEEGQRILAEAINLLRHGKSDKDLLEEGYDSDTIGRAIDALVILGEILREEKGSKTACKKRCF